MYATCLTGGRQFMNGFDTYYPKRETLTTTEPWELSHIETQNSLIKAVHTHSDTSIPPLHSGV